MRFIQNVWLSAHSCWHIFFLLDVNIMQLTHVPFSTLNILYWKISWKRPLTTEITQCQRWIHLQCESSVNRNGKIHQKSSNECIRASMECNWKKSARESVNKWKPIYHLTLICWARARNFIQTQLLTQINTLESSVCLSSAHRNIQFAISNCVIKVVVQ